MRHWAILIYSYWLDLTGARSRFSAKSKKAPPPDPNIGIAAAQQSAIAGQQLDFSKQQYADQKAEMERMRPLIEKTLQGQIDLTDMTTRQALESEQHYKSTFKPLEERFAADAAKAGSQAEQSSAAAASGVDVQRQIDMQREASGRSMASMGVNPNSGRFQGMDRSAQIMGAAAKVGSMNAAAAQERNRGDMMRQAAIQTGRGIAGHSLAATGVATNTGNSSINVGQTPFNMNMAAGGQYMQGMGQAGQMYGSSANTYLGLHGAQMNTWQQNQAQRGQLLGAVGGIAGMAMGGGFGQQLGKSLFSGTSDRRLKRNIRVVGMTPGGKFVYDYEYIWGEPGRGVMAQENPGASRMAAHGFYEVDYSKVA
jgi:hypothetical protein